MITELNEKNFKDYIKDGIKFISFGATWCGYCQKQKPILEEMSNANILIGYVDADKNTKLTQEYGIQAFPSFLLFEGGKLIAKFAGYKSKNDLLNTLISYLE